MSRKTVASTPTATCESVCSLLHNYQHSIPAACCLALLSSLFMWSFMSQAHDAVGAQLSFVFDFCFYLFTFSFSLRSLRSYALLYSVTWTWPEVGQKWWVFFSVNAVKGVPWVFGLELETHQINRFKLRLWKTRTWVYMTPWLLQSVYIRRAGGWWVSTRLM